VAQASKQGLPTCPKPYIVVCYAVAGIKEHPTLSRGMSLNSVPCFRNTFPAAQKILKPLLRILITYLGTGLNNRPECNSNRYISKHERKRKPPTLNDREKQDSKTLLEDWV